MFKSKDYIGVDRVDKFFKHYGVKGMKWKNHTYAVDDEPVSTAKKVSRVDPALKKAVKIAGKAYTVGRNAAGNLAARSAVSKAAKSGLSGGYSTETNLKPAARLIEAYSGPRSEAEAKERASRAATRSGAKAPQLIDMTESVQKSLRAKKTANMPKSEAEAKEKASAAATKAGANAKMRRAMKEANAAASGAEARSRERERNLPDAKRAAALANSKATLENLYNQSVSTALPKYAEAYDKKGRANTDKGYWYNRLKSTDAETSEKYGNYLKNGNKATRDKLRDEYKSDLNATLSSLKKSRSDIDAYNKEADEELRAINKRRRK